MSGSQEKFITEIEKLISNYEKEKGSFRKLNTWLFGKSAFFGHSSYMDDLIAQVESLKKKDTWTLKDFEWFAKECYLSEGKYHNPQFYGVGGSLSADIYKKVEKLMNAHSYDIPGRYKHALENARANTRNIMRDYGENASYYSYDATLRYQLNGNLTKVVSKPNKSSILSETPEKENLRSTSATIQSSLKEDRKVATLPQQPLKPKTPATIQTSTVVHKNERCPASVMQENQRVTIAATPQRKSLIAAALKPTENGFEEVQPFIYPIRQRDGSFFNPPLPFATEEEKPVDLIDLSEENLNQIRQDVGIGTFNPTQISATEEKKSVLLADLSEAELNKMKQDHEATQKAKQTFEVEKKTQLTSLFSQRQLEHARCDKQNTVLDNKKKPSDPKLKNANTSTQQTLFNKLKNLFVPSHEPQEKPLPPTLNRKVAA